MNYTEQHEGHEAFMKRPYNENHTDTFTKSEGSTWYFYAGLFFILLFSACVYDNYSLHKKNMVLKKEIKTLDSLVTVKHNTIERLKILYMLKK